MLLLLILLLLNIFFVSKNKNFNDLEKLLNLFYFFFNFLSIVDDMRNILL